MSEGESAIQYRYWMFNRFHKTRTFVRVREEGLVSGRVMRRAWRRLCPYDDCCCWMNETVRAWPGRPEGVPARPDLWLVRAILEPAAAARAGWDGRDMDAHVVVSVGDPGRQTPTWPRSFSRRSQRARAAEGQP